MVFQARAFCKDYFNGGNKNDQKKTLKKQENCKTITKYEPEENLKKVKPEDILKALILCIEYSDYESFRDVVEAYIKINNKTELAKNMGVSRRALYHMISEDANPTIKNIMNFYQAIKKVA